MLCFDKHRVRTWRDQKKKNTHTQSELPVKKSCFQCAGIQLSLWQTVAPPAESCTTKTNWRKRWGWRGSGVFDTVFIVAASRAPYLTIFNNTQHNKTRHSSYHRLPPRFQTLTTSNYNKPALTSSADYFKYLRNLPGFTLKIK